MNKTEWLEIVAKRESSGISIKTWCEQNGLNHSTYQYWARKFKDEKREWAKVDVPAATVSKEIKIYCNKWTIIANEGVTVSLLTDVLKAVDSVCC
jgi:transposase-like protein